MYKIFGAAAIVGLFLLSSIASTGLALEAEPKMKEGELKTITKGLPQAEPQPQPRQQQMYNIEPIEWDGDVYDLEEYPGESMGYPNDFPFVKNGDLATTLIFRWRPVPIGHNAIITAQIRNVVPVPPGAAEFRSKGGEAQLRVYKTIAGIPIPGAIFISDWKTVNALLPWIPSDRIHYGTVALPGNLYFVTHNINPNAYEGPGRHLSIRCGYILGFPVQ